MKPYIFNGKEFDNLNNLALAYKDNFELGVKDIYENTSKFLKFVKSNTKNKERIKAITNDIYLSKYKNNGLTFVIYDLLDVKEVVINGKSVDFKQFIQLITENPNTDNALFKFLEDHGVTRCYERLDPSSKYFKDMYFVERNYDHEFTYKYLSTLFTFEKKESIAAKMTSIAIQNEECFRRASKLIRNDQFMLSVAHMYGFREAISAIKEKNGLFYVCKLFNHDKKYGIEDDQLRRMFSDSFFWWLYDNYEAYVAKGKAKQVMQRIKRIKKEFSKFATEKDGKQIAKINFDFYTEVSRKLYLAYLDFVYYYRAGLIVPSKEVEASKFEFDKPYCKTYITESYMAGKVIKLYNPNATSTQLDVNPLTGEKIERDNSTKTIDIDDISDEAPQDELLLADDEIFDREVKAIKKNARFAYVAVLLGLANAVVSAFGILINKSTSTGKAIELFKEAYTKPLIIGGALAGLLAVFFGVIICVLENRRIKAFNDYHFIIDANTNTVMTLEEEAYLSCVTSDEKVIKHSILKNTFISSLLATIFLSISCGMVGILSAAGLNYITDKINFVDGYTTISQIILYAAPAGIGALAGLLFKKKGLIFGLLLGSLTCAVSVLIIFIFGLIA